MSLFCFKRVIKMPIIEPAKLQRRKNSIPYDKACFIKINWNF
jgi:hypothetical protein